MTDPPIPSPIGPREAAAAPEGARPPPRGLAEFNYFAEREQALQAGFRAARDRWLAPLVRLCQRLGITAEVVSGLALAMLAPVAVNMLWPLGLWSPVLVIGGLALHVALDGLDGPLARAAGTDGPAGAFTDMCLDHVGYLIVVGLCAGSGLLSGGVACAYGSTYTVAVVMIVMLNLLGRPLRYVLRTKYLFYVLIAVELCAGPQWLNAAAIAFSVVHGLTAIVGFAAVRRALRSDRPTSP